MPVNTIKQAAKTPAEQQNQTTKKPEPKTQTLNKTQRPKSKDTSNKCKQNTQNYHQKKNSKGSILIKNTQKHPQIKEKNTPNQKTTEQKKHITPQKKKQQKNIPPKNKTSNFKKLNKTCKTIQKTSYKFWKQPQQQTSPEAFATAYGSSKCSCPSTEGAEWVSERALCIFWRNMFLLVLNRFFFAIFDFWPYRKCVLGHLFIYSGLLKQIQVVTARKGVWTGEAASIRFLLFFLFVLVVCEVGILETVFLSGCCLPLWKVKPNSWSCFFELLKRYKPVTLIVNWLVSVSIQDRTRKKKNNFIKRHNKQTTHAQKKQTNEFPKITTTNSQDTKQTKGTTPTAPSKTHKTPFVSKQSTIKQKNNFKKIHYTSTTPTTKKDVQK